MENQNRLQTLNTAEQLRAQNMLDHGARSDIEIFCRVGETEREASGIVLWIDISALPECPVERSITQDAIWWCETRDLFTRHPGNPNLVRFHTRARNQYQALAASA